MREITIETVKNSGVGGFGLTVIYLLLSIQTEITELNKVVANNDERLDVLEYKLHSE